SPSRVCAFSRARSRSTSASKAARSLTGGSLDALAVLTADSPRIVGSPFMAVSSFVPPACLLESLSRGLPSGHMETGKARRIDVPDSILVTDTLGDLSYTCAFELTPRANDA